MPAGLRSLLIANCSEEVTALNQRAHHTGIAMKDVAEHGLELQDGTTAALGDWVVTRRHHRRDPKLTDSPTMSRGHMRTAAKPRGLTKAFRGIGFHPAVLRDPAVPRPLRYLQVPADGVEFRAASEEGVALGKLTNDLVKGVTATSQGPCCSLLRSPRPGAR
jgi:hypothetical protein